MSENNIEALVKEIVTHKGVQGFIIVNHEGIPIRHSFHDSSRLLAVHYSALMQQLAQKARRAVQSIDPTQELQFLRIRSRKHEILVAPHDQYILIVIQSPDV